MKVAKIIYGLFFLFISMISTVFSQKKNIDSNAYTMWSSVGAASMSNNGQYVSYMVENEPVGSNTLVMKSTRNNWEKNFRDILKYNIPLISKGGKYALFLNINDSLTIVSLGKNLVQYIPNVSSFKMPRNEVSEWIAYQFKKSNNQLILQNVNTGKKYVYEDVINKVLGEDGQTLILQAEKKVNNQTIQTLNWIDLSTGKSTLIIEGLNARNIILDTKHKQLAFTSEKGGFSYNMNTHKLNSLINQTTRLDSGLKFGGIRRFSKDGERLFIELKEEDKPKLKDGFVEVWSYLDLKLQSQQENEIGNRTYAAVMGLKDGKVIRLEQEFENLSSNSIEDGSSDTIGLITGVAKSNGDLDNMNKYSYYLISLKSGRRIPLKYKPEELSTSGKYVIYVDPEKHTYVSYNTKTGVHQTISKTFSESHKEQGLERRTIAGWLDNEEGVLIYDNYDIWRMDLTGKKAPINLTAGYGRKYDLAFSIVYGQFSPKPINGLQKIILTAFNLKSKQNGFYSFKLDKVNEPELLSIGNYIYYAPPGIQIDMEHAGFVPLKGKNAEIYLVCRMSAKESPNYFSTRDFKKFTALSSVYPEREHNWYTTELQSWTSLDGKKLQGILYKPENFDPKKKYPVIFHYYEMLSNNLNAYLRPEVLCNGCNIDIPTYVNNGYLVFTPDIVYKIGDPMQGTYDAVVSAAKYIGHLSFVDSTKMGIQGCSWGGIQTNYLVTHTNLFAAACSASGIADWIAHYGKLRGGGPNYGNGQLRMGRSIWEIPNAYIKNSPIFQLDKTTTPLLIMHTKKDEACAYDNAVELFIGLRQLGKRNWMLTYSEGNHGVWGKEAKDFSTRMMQFFDHYLKDKPAPIWMTRGIRAERRGLDDGFAYDTKIGTPGPGLLTLSEQKTVDSIMTRKPILIELK